MGHKIPDVVNFSRHSSASEAAHRRFKPALPFLECRKIFSVKDLFQVINISNSLFWEFLSQSAKNDLA